ncbi:MAG: hypothetical protein PHY28_00220 [Dehalococcoidales bacterium]|nr:hypothetical protein [Dehalococcoidales bacterium]
MKRLFLAFIFILTLLASTLPDGTALAVEAISVSPVSGRVGTTVFVYGNGYTAGDNYQILFAGTTLVNTGIVPALATTFVNSFTVPQFTPGITSVVVYNITTATYAYANFTVTGPSITLGASSGIQGQQVVISGENYAASTTVSITIGTRALVTATTNANGAFMATFTVPEYPGGTHNITAADSYGNSKSASFLITPIATITPDSGAIGTDISVQGKGFLASTAITLLYNDLDVTTVPATTTSNTSGSFTTTFKIPAGSGGSHQLVISDGTNQIEAALTTTASFSINPQNTSVGGEIQATGTGFIADQPVNIYLGEVLVRNVSADANGSFTTRFVVPPISSGNYVVKASDGSSDTAAQLSVSVEANLSAASGLIGSAVTISGTGFSGMVYVKFDGVEVSRKAAEANGSFSITFNVPAGKAGNHVITASDGHNTITENFAVTVEATLTQSTGPLGMPVTMTGSGFSGAIIIGFDGSEIAQTNSDERGAFSATFNIPVSKAGNHTIVATDKTNIIETTFTVESNPPPVSEPLLPASDTKAKAQAQFDWSDVSDPSGISYVLEIATSKTFTADSIVLQKVNLTESTYTLTKAEKLVSSKKDAPYYWRVKAIDGASNEGNWTTASSFNVGFTFSGFPVWAIVLLSIIGVLVILLVGIWLGRKSTYY